jgi:hypothetical protein
VKRGLPIVAVGAALALELAMTWRRWGDLVYDCGRELEVPRQLAAGRLLYADVRWYYGPLAPYLNAALYRLFGVRAGVLMAAGVVSAVAMSGIVYALARRLSTTLAATVAAVAFVGVCAFGHYYMNGAFTWALPYTYAATYGMLAAAASLLALVRYVQDGRPRDLDASVACLAVAVLSKVEATLPIVAAHAIFVGLAWRRVRLRPYLVAAVASIAVYAGFAAAMGTGRFGDVFRDVIASRAQSAFFVRHMGLDDLPHALSQIVASGLALGLAVAVTAGVARVAAGVRPETRLGWSLILTAAALAAVGYAALPLDVPFAVLPLVAAGMVVWLAWRWWRRPDERDGTLPHLLLWIFALGCLARMPLTASAYLYGFYLLPVPMTALVVVWFGSGPRLGRSPLGSWLVSAVGVGLFAGVLVAHVNAARAFYDRHTTLVDTPRGRIYLLDEVAGFPIGAIHAAAIARLAHFPPSTRVMAVPQGAGLAFFAGLPSWDGMHSFLPTEVSDDAADEALQLALEQDPPEVIVSLGIDLHEYGSRGFGRDYATRTAQWILANYERDTPNLPGQYAQILRGKDTPAPP